MQLHEQHALLYLFTQSVFFCSAVSAARRAPSRSVLFFLFSSIVWGVLRWSLREHNGAILTTLEALLREHDGSISTTSWIYVENIVVLRYTCINFSYFSQRAMPIWAWKDPSFVKKRDVENPRFSTVKKNTTFL